MNNLLNFLINSQTNFINFIRFAICIVMVWIGGLKAFQYEADGIVPFVTNSPLMSLLFRRNSNSPTLRARILQTH